MDRVGCAALVLLLSALAAWSEPAATIDGAPVVTLADLQEAAASATDRYEAAMLRCRIDADRDLDDAKQATLRDLVHAELRALEAARLGIEPEALADRIDDGAESVTDDDVAAFHRERAIAQPLAEIGPAIRAHLERQATDAARAAAYADLERRYDVAYLLEPLRYDVAADGFPSYFGPDDAPVTIVEFSDFECPFCARLLPALADVKRQYAGKVRLVYRHFPLTGIHPNAWKAAEASLCAAEQGRFGDLHDAMFADQGALTVADLKATAAREVRLCRSRPR